MHANPRERSSGIHPVLVVDASARGWATQRPCCVGALLALAAMALVLGLVACGGVADRLEPAGARGKTERDAGGVKMHIDAKFSAAGSPPSLSADGVFDGDEGELTMNLGDLLGQAGIAGDGEVKVIVDEGRRSPGPVRAHARRSRRPARRQGLDEARRRAGDAQVGAGGNAKDILGATGQSPADALELLAQGRPASPRSAPRRSTGRETTHYRATVDVERGAQERRRARRGARRRARAAASRRRCRSTSGSGDDGYVHRVHIAYATDAGGQSVSGELTMTLSDWGTDVSIDVPDDDEVLDATQLLAPRREALGRLPRRGPANAARCRRARASCAARRAPGPPSRGRSPSCGSRGRAGAAPA